MEKKHYNPVTIFIHWLTLCVIVAVFASIEIAISFERGSETRDLFSSMHFYLGATLFVITLFRLVVKLTSHKPVIHPTPSKMQNRITQIVHIALYALMLLIPIAGLALLNSTGKSLIVFGQALPTLVETNRALTATIRERHALLGFTLLTLIAIHTAAALFHHFIIKDNTLSRMMPRAKTKSAQPKAEPTVD